MYSGKFLPEGDLIGTVQNTSYLLNSDGLRKAMVDGAVLEAVVSVCDAQKNLILDLGGITGIIPKSEAAIGTASGPVRDIAIIGRVGKPTCFMVDSVGPDESGRVIAKCSRRRAQAAAQAEMMLLEPGEVIPARVTHLESFGAFVDIGCGVVSLIGIEHISVSRISHPADRFSTGDRIFVCVSSVDHALGRVVLTHRELLGTWEENVALFSVGETVPGVVRGLEAYGAFVELTPNLSGLAELREGLHDGERVSVFIKSILPDRMKIKLIIIDTLDDVFLPPRKPDYLIQTGKISHWRYSPEVCFDKRIETVFLS